MLQKVNVDVANFNYIFFTLSRCCVKHVMVGMFSLESNDSHFYTCILMLQDTISNVIAISNVFLYIYFNVAKMINPWQINTLSLSNLFIL